MSMLNLIWINIHLMNMKRHMLIYFFIFMLVDREKEWGSYKIEVVIKKNGKKILRKLKEKKVVNKKKMKLVSSKVR
jgi:hypothetical protein